MGGLINNMETFLRGKGQKIDLQMLWPGMS